MKLILLLLLVLGAGHLLTWWIPIVATILSVALIGSVYLFIRVMGGHLTYNGLFKE